MKKVPVVALLTDFGHRDPFVGVVKGVILRKAPGANIVDLTHEVPPQDIRAAAFHLLTSHAYFPDGALFVAVVDPGVGTKRPVLYAETARHRFLAPDNGLLSWVFKREKPRLLRRVEDRTLMLPNVSATFHGRDIFAPVAGALARGLSPETLGPVVSSWIKLPFPASRRSGGAAKGEVLAVDHFGNLITNLCPDELPGGPWVFSANGFTAVLRNNYAGVGAGRPVAVVGSSGHIELSIRNGSAAERWGVKAGDKVLARKGKK